MSSNARALLALIIGALLFTSASHGDQALESGVAGERIRLQPRAASPQMNLSVNTNFKIGFFVDGGAPARFVNDVTLAEDLSEVKLLPFSRFESSTKAEDVSDSPVNTGGGMSPLAVLAGLGVVVACATVVAGRPSSNRLSVNSRDLRRRRVRSSEVKPRDQPTRRRRRKSRGRSSHGVAIKG